MATNDYEIQVNTDDYDEFLYGGEPESLPGSPVAINEQGHLVIPSDGWLVHQSHDPSVMDPENTGATTDFWSAYPITIDINGNIFYYGENTGINVRGPAGETNIIQWDDLTPEQIELLKGEKGQDGAPGTPGTNGTNGTNGKSAYELWLEQHGYDPQEHSLDEFYTFIADQATQIVKQGTGTGSIILNYEGTQDQVASGTGATSIGSHTTAAAPNSIAAGSYTTTSNANQLVIGTYNNPQQNTLFEIGNGSQGLPSNALIVTSTGNVQISGEFTNGNGDTLSNKVDKVPGKELSTNDFTDNDKNFIRNYHIDTQITSGSTNPPTSNAVALYVDSAIGTVDTSKVQQSVTGADVYYPFFHPSVQTTGDLQTVLYSSGLQWNPNKKTLRMATTITGNNTIALGQELTSATNGQTIFGKYNETNSQHIFQIGNGTANSSRSNALTLTNTGNLKVAGTVEDGSGNKLNQKQNTLIYDNTIVEDSPNMVTSGTIYEFLSNMGLSTEYDCFIDPRTDQILDALDTINTRLTSITNMINAHELIDDTTGNTYTYGIDNDEFYIKLKENANNNNNGGGE